MFASAGVGINVWVFSAYDIPHRCPDDDGCNPSYDNTCAYTTCDGDNATVVGTCSKSDLVFDRSVVASSASVDFGLTCEESKWRAWLGTAFQFGMLAGSWGVSEVSDRFGRRSGLTVAGVFSVAGAVGCAVAESAVFYGVCR